MVKQSDISVHDNFVISYTVSGNPSEIRICTEYRDRGEPFERTDVIFREVLAYHFHQDNFTTILLDIEEWPLETVVAEYQDLFERGVKYGWPGPWNTQGADIVTLLEEQGAKGWRIFASCGMEGFVIAQDVEVVRIK